MVPLSVRSSWSLLMGVDPPERWVAAAREAGLPAIALTDMATLAGVVPFVKAAQAARVHPVIGATLTLNETDPGLVLLVRDGFGWQALCQGISHWRFGRREEAWRVLTEGASSLVALPGSSRWLWRALQVPAWHDVPGSLYARVLPSEDNAPPARRKERAALLTLARQNRVSFVAATDAVSIDATGLPAHKIVRALSLKTTVHRLQEGQVARPTAVFPTGEIQRRFAGIPDAVTNTYRIVEACTFLPSLGKPLFPPAPEGTEPGAYLLREVNRGLSRRYPDAIPAEALGRVRRELGVINQMGYASYFLVVHDIVREATRRGIPTLGRGSAANSTVAYALGITHVDPVRHHLFFERFLNPERLDPPDIDLDLPWDRREEMCRYLYTRYGEEHVAMVGAFSTMKTRALFREVGRGLGLPPDTLNRMSRSLPGGSLRGLEEAMTQGHPVYRELPLHKAPWRQVLGLARRLSGLPHHFSIHPCGIAVSGVPVNRVLPVVPSPSVWPTTDADMGPAEELGLIKIDLLGNRSMSVLTDALDELGLRDTENAEGGLDPQEAIADPATANLLAKGQTVGCFYIESPSMRSIMQRLECRDYETLVAASSIIRPGVNQGGLMDAFVRRHRGEEADSYPDDRLIPFLKETHGILVYQEQVIQTAATVAGMSLGEADQLRRAMGKKRHHPAEAMERYRARFVGGALKGGMTSEKADALWRQIESFAGYAFCKAHSASFARLSYQMAWLRAHHPALFFACVLRHEGGFYHPQVYVDAARRLGIRPLPPCVVHGRWETEAAGENAIRIGLQYMRGIRKEVAEAIKRERPFRDWEDLLKRVRPDRETAAMLVLSGATDQLAGSVTPHIRRERLWQAEMQDRPSPAARRQYELGFEEETGEEIPVEVPMEASDEETLEQCLTREIESMGLALADHPLRLFRSRLWSLRDRVTPAERLPHMPEGRVVTCVGLPVARKSMHTKHGEPMSFLTLSDRTGLIETVLFPNIIQRIGPRLHHAGPWTVRGVIQEGTVVVKTASIT